MGLDLVTLAEYKAYAGITSPNQDTQIKAIIPAVSQLVKTYCNRTFVDFVDDTNVDMFSGGFPTLEVSEYPIISVSSVEYSGDYGKTYTALTEFTDYVVDIENDCIQVLPPVNFCLYSSNINKFKQTYDTPIFPKAINGYRVTYTAGYTDIPMDLKLATLDLVTYYMKSDMAIHSQRNAGANTVQIEYITKNKLPSHIANVLDFYVAYVN